jgi:uncharacterized PurR-regulated membrane protein YhhQ (DUF165 family)
MINITIADVIASTVGILLWWVLVYSMEKDKFDNEGKHMNFREWCSAWFSKNNDNILLHFILTGFLLVMGVENTKALLSDYFDVPEGLNGVGASGMIGFSGSLVSDLLKKLIKKVKR